MDVDASLTTRATTALSNARDPRAMLENPGDAEAPRKFQALLATMLVKQMRTSIGGELFGTGSQGEVFGGWFDQQIGDVFASRDSLHLESVLADSLARKARGDGG